MEEAIITGYVYVILGSHEVTLPWIHEVCMGIWYPPQLKNWTHDDRKGQGNASSDAAGRECSVDGSRQSMM